MRLKLLDQLNQLELQELIEAVDEIDKPDRYHQTISTNTLMSQIASQLATTRLYKETLTYLAGQTGVFLNNLMKPCCKY
jgi:hypothetical protein